MDRRYSLGAIIVLLLAGALYAWLHPDQQPTVGTATPPIAVTPVPSAQPKPASPPRTSTGTTARPAPSPSPSGGRARFGLYVLAMSWFPAFCELKPRVPECRDVSPRLALHGLWPGDEYCGVTPALESRDTSGDWNGLPEIDLSDATRSALADAMPGTRSHLERHEWLAHGTCSGASAEAYFARAASLAITFRNAAVGDFLAANRGRAVTRAQVQAAADREFGAGVGRRIRLSCEDDGHRQIIDELTVALYGDVVSGGRGLAELMLAAHPRNGGCESGFVQ